MKLPLRLMWLLMGAGISAMEFHEAYKTGRVSYALYGAGFLLMTVAWVIRPLSLRTDIGRMFTRDGAQAFVQQSKELAIGPSWVYTASAMAGMALLWVGLAVHYLLKA